MRKAFASLDDLLIERFFQPVAILIANHTSLSQDRAIRCCLDTASFAWILSRVGVLSNAMSVPEPALVLLNVGLLLLGLTALMSLRILFRRPKSRQANPLRPAMQPHRAVVLLMLASNLLRAPPSGLGDMADMVMLVCTAAGLYLGACAGHPPRRRRLGFALRWPRPLRGTA